MKWLKQQSAIVLVLSSCILICVSIFIGKLPFISSDPRGALVVSQNIIKSHSLTLDNVASYWDKGDGQYTYHIFKSGNHSYYTYPYGTPLISLPFVLMANISGLDMRRSELIMQEILCSLVAIGIFITIYVLANVYFSIPISVAIGLVGFYGTTVGTVVGTGLWNLDYDILFSGAAVLLSLLYVKTEYRIRILNIDIVPMLIGITLFMAFISRPTSSILTACIFLFFMRHERSAFLKMAISSLMLLLLYIAVVYVHVPGPGYGAGGFSPLNAVTALKGFLWSPSRSVLIFDPFIVLLPLFSFYFFKTRVRSQIKSLVLHLLLSSILLFSLLLFWRGWYGGYCYGPRIYADGIYTSFLILVIIIGELSITMDIAYSKIISKAFAIAMIIGFMINIQGIFNEYAIAWNAYPVVDEYHSVLFDWRFPQFMMTKGMFTRKYVIEGSELGAIPKPVQIASNIDNINISVRRYLRGGKDLDRLNPGILEKMGFLDVSFGAYPVNARNNNWTKNGYWIGRWGKDAYAIGFYPAITDQVRYLYNIYSKEAKAVYFPFPKTFSPKTASRYEYGEILIEFNK